MKLNTIKAYPHLFTSDPEEIIEQMKGLKIVLITSCSSFTKIAERTVRSLENTKFTKLALGFHAPWLASHSHPKLRGAEGKKFWMKGSHLYCIVVRLSQCYINYIIMITHESTMHV